MYVYLLIFYLLTYLLTYLLLRVSFPRLSRMRTRILCKEGVTHSIAQNAATANVAASLATVLTSALQPFQKRLSLSIVDTRTERNFGYSHIE